MLAREGGGEREGWGERGGEGGERQTDRQTDRIGGSGGESRVEVISKTADLASSRHQSLSATVTSHICAQVVFRRADC